jgi:hypothetical protein
MPTRVAALASARPSSSAHQPRNTAELPGSFAIDGYGLLYIPRSARPRCTDRSKNSPFAHRSLATGVTSDSRKARNSTMVCFSASERVFS